MTSWCLCSVRVHRGGPGGAAHRGGEVEVGGVEDSARGLQPPAAEPPPLLHLPLPGHRGQRARPQQSQRALGPPQHAASWSVTPGADTVTCCYY